jgi:hypothetical protein
MDFDEKHKNEKRRQRGFQVEHHNGHCLTGSWVAPRPSLLGKSTSAAKSRCVHGQKLPDGELEIEEVHAIFGRVLEHYMCGCCFGGRQVMHYMCRVLDTIASCLPMEISQNPIQTHPLFIDS